MQSYPIGLGGGANTCNYVNSNPLNATDPFGLDPANTFVMADKNSSDLANILNLPITTATKYIVVGPDEKNDIVIKGWAKYYIGYFNIIINPQKELNAVSIMKKFIPIGKK